MAGLEEVYNLADNSQFDIEILEDFSNTNTLVFEVKFNPQGSDDSNHSKSGKLKFVMSEDYPDVLPTITSCFAPMLDDQYIKFCLTTFMETVNKSQEDELLEKIIRYFRDDIYPDLLEDLDTKSTYRKGLQNFSDNASSDGDNVEIVKILTKKTKAKRSIKESSTSSFIKEASEIECRPRPISPFVPKNGWTKTKIPFFIPFLEYERYSMFKTNSDENLWRAIEEVYKSFVEKYPSVIDRGCFFKHSLSKEELKNIDFVRPYDENYDVIITTRKAQMDEYQLETLPINWVWLKHAVKGQPMEWVLSTGSDPNNGHGLWKHWTPVEKIATDKNAANSQAHMARRKWAGMSVTAPDLAMKYTCLRSHEIIARHRQGDQTFSALANRFEKIVQPYLVTGTVGKIKNKAMTDLKFLKSLTSYLRDVVLVLEKMEHMKYKDPEKPKRGDRKIQNRGNKKRALIKNSMQYNAMQYKSQ